MTPEERAARALGSAEADQGRIQDAVAREIREAVADAQREKRRARKIERNARPMAKRSTPRRSGRVRDDEFLTWVRSQPCVLSADPHASACRGRIEANHAGPRPYGRKSDDDTAITMCNEHHRTWTEYRGFFRGMSRAERRDWADARIAELRHRYIMGGGVLARYAS